MTLFRVSPIREFGIPAPNCDQGRSVACPRTQEAFSGRLSTSLPTRLGELGAAMPDLLKSMDGPTDVRNAMRLANPSNSPSPSRKLARTYGVGRLPNLTVKTVV
jgi:hypothetical protein